jgi:hypothetical protein
MNHHRTLVITSLLSILLALIHVTEDVVRGIERGGPEMFNGVLIAAMWLYATVGLAEGRIKYGLLLVFSIGAAGVSYIHMRGAGLAGGRIANSEGVFFWVLTLLTLGALGVCSVLLSARGLWGWWRNPKQL